MAAKKTIPKLTLTDEQFHAITRALADPRRFAILQQIAARKCMPCSALDAHHDISAATISHHMKELITAGLVHSERSGRFMNLTLARPIWNAYRRRLATL